MAYPGHRGRLLVATPVLGDPNFDRTVVLVLEHTEVAAVGVVLNRPTEVPVGEHLPDWAPLAAPPAVLFIGGPVVPSGLICIGEGDGSEPAGIVPVAGGLVSADLAMDPADIGTAIAGVRVFAGHAGWGEGQLDDEVAAGAWFVVDLDDGDVLTSGPDALWKRVLRRQGGRLAMFANAPLDPKVN